MRMQAATVSDLIWFYTIQTNANASCNCKWFDSIDLIQLNAIWFDTIQCNLMICIWCKLIWFNSKFNAIWFDSIKCNLIWYNWMQFDLMICIWCKLIWSILFDKIWNDLNLFQIHYMQVDLISALYLDLRQFDIYYACIWYNLKRFDFIW